MFIMPSQPPGPPLKIGITVLFIITTKLIDNYNKKK